MTVEQLNDHGQLRHLISLADLSRTEIEKILDRANHYLTPIGQPPPRDTILQGHTVANLFFEASTRTRASFELAAKRLSADVLNLDVNMSSRAKGESLLDTIYTLQAMQVDIFVVRDAGTGVPMRIADHVFPHVSVLNAGESDTSHPTQGLLDLMTIQKHKGDVGNLCVAIVGDIRHSRVARSATEALTKFGVGELRLVGPQELLPKEPIEGTQSYAELDRGIEGADVVMALRIQKERFAQLGDIPDPQEYFRRFGLAEERMQIAKPDAIVMHPGPMNRGVEIDGALADGPRSVIQEQVTNGLAVRMAVLSLVYEHVLTTRGEQC
ncbi:MAG: aspartate carbamoyltransferase catalytic subunit [Gammaproteobacteria bacterium]|nr:aspartate carbamoyltransferase catalytic subunit [Gammaproteobacteria bacterium]MDH3506188.1 aspartate carbamoyltransferase catalytic subunit [Gammaproteobacteria bacterium]